MKRKSLIWGLALLLLILVPLAGAQQSLPDTDGDGVPDEFDSCPAEAGSNMNEGCPEGVIPDRDGDGVPNRDDYCYDQVGVPEFRGCPADAYPDLDGDGVPDWDDSCIDQAGLVENSGCPESVIPDYDTDGIPDAEDLCPREYGDAANQGCIPDADSDGVADELDTCPELAGVFENAGCPPGFELPDDDGDGIPNPFDSCPNEAGSEMSGGCPDTDGDTIPDLYDLCPDEAGDMNLSGCTLIDSVSISPNRAPLTAENIGNLSEQGTLRIGAWLLALGGNNQLVAQTSYGLSLYDLNSPDLVPVPFGNLESGQIDVSRAASVLAHVSYSSASGFPTISLFDLPSQNVLAQVPMTAYTFNNLALSADGRLLATTHASDFSQPDVPDNNVRIWDTASGALLKTLPYGMGIAGGVFSPDGRFFAAQTFEQEVVIWDVAAGGEVAKLEGSWSPFVSSASSLRFSPDSSLFVTFGAQNNLNVWNTSDFSLVQSFSPAGADTPFVITNLAFSPDGSLIAITDGVVYFEGPIGAIPEINNFGNLYVLDRASGQLLFSLPTENSPISSVVFSEDGSLLIFNEGVFVHFWGVGQ